mmetsp:Transcript_7323/g.21288  ORF Transcript_7323/g.21288 Transcript_7323/m.21288 type:complete len:284 (+) Transcript_7323:1213-2064(+)
MQWFRFHRIIIKLNSHVRACLLRLLLSLWLLRIVRAGQPSHHVAANDGHGSGLRSLCHHLFEFRLLIGTAFVIPIDVRRRECQSRRDHDQPPEVELQDPNDHEARPNRGGSVQSGPKDGTVKLVDVSVLGTLENPGRFVAIDLVPPAQSDQEPTGDILDHPEIGRQQKDADHRDGNEIGTAVPPLAIGGEPSSKNIEKEGQALEEQVEDANDGMGRLRERLAQERVAGGLGGGSDGHRRRVVEGRGIFHAVLRYRKVQVVRSHLVVFCFLLLFFVVVVVVVDD